MKIQLYNIKEETTVDGPGLRTSIYLQGCPIHCKGCHNKGSWGFRGGQSVEINDLVAMLEGDPFIEGVSILGGEPFCQREALLKLVETIRKRVPRLTIWIFSGYTIEILRKDPISTKILSKIDTLVDGPFKEELKDLTLQFRGSPNQRIINNPSKFKV